MSEMSWRKTPSVAGFRKALLERDALGNYEGPPVSAELRLLGVLGCRQGRTRRLRALHTCRSPPRRPTCPFPARCHHLLSTKLPRHSPRIAALILTFRSLASDNCLGVMGSAYERHFGQARSPWRLARQDGPTANDAGPALGARVRQVKSGDGADLGERQSLFPEVIPFDVRGQPCVHRAHRQHLLLHGATVRRPPWRQAGPPRGCRVERRHQRTSLNP